MPADALLLALAAAAVHAGWNVLLAGRRDPEAATAVALTAGVVIFAPVAAATWDVGHDAVPYLAASAALELAYIVLLAAAYARAQLSLVYPLARGLGPVLVLAVGVLALGAPTSATQLAGILVVAAGVVAVRGPRGKADRRGALFGLAIAGTIAGYTLVDNSGVERADPLAYFELVLVGPAAAYLVAIAALRGRGALRAELGPATVLAGAGMFGAYALALLALRLAPAAPVAAVRETGIVLAAFLAAALLGEDVGRLRLAGAALVAAGVALIAAG